MSAQVFARPQRACAGEGEHDGGCWSGELSTRMAWPVEALAQSGVPAVVFAGAAVLTAWFVARALRLGDLFAWREIARTSEGLSGLAEAIEGSKSVVRHGSGLRRVLGGDQESLVSAARAVLRCGADPTVARAVIEEFAEGLLATRRRVRLCLVACVLGLPGLGLLRLSASMDALRGAGSDPFVGTVAAGWGLPLILGSLLAGAGVLGVSMLRRADRADRRVWIDVEVLTLLAEEAAEGGSVRSAAEALAARLGTVGTAGAGEGEARAA